VPPRESSLNGHSEPWLISQKMRGFTRNAKHIRNSREIISPTLRIWKMFSFDVIRSFKGFLKGQKTAFFTIKRVVDGLARSRNHQDSEPWHAVCIFL
jgi:hypothetical protein